MPAEQRVNVVSLGGVVLVTVQEVVILPVGIEEPVFTGVRHKVHP
jgi:hypothetical protein